MNGVIFGATTVPITTDMPWFTLTTSTHDGSAFYGIVTCAVQVRYPPHPRQS